MMKRRIGGKDNIFSSRLMIVGYLVLAISLIQTVVNGTNY